MILPSQLYGLIESLGAFESAAQIAGQIRDLHDDKLDSWFAIVDPEGRYTCPQCDKTQTFGQGEGSDSA